MSETDLTKFLWKQHNLVYLRPANANDFELLDVLVKIEEKGAFRRRPVLVRIGSIFGVAGRITTPYHDAQPDLEAEDEEDDDDDDDEITLEALKEELQELRSLGPDFKGKYLHTFFHGRRWRFKGDSSGSVEACASEIGSLGGGAAAGRVFTINNIESESVDTGALSECLSSETNPWTPNIDYIRKWCAPRNKRELELWVVTKLVYHSSIHFQNNTDRGVQIGVADLPMRIGARANTNREVEVDIGAPPARIAFAYQAIRLIYNLEDGKLANPRLHMGTAQPTIMRKAAGGEGIITDPDVHPDYNMAELLDMEAWDSLAIQSAASTDSSTSTAP